MLDDLIALRNQFEKVKNMGWVESKRKGTTGIGYTFESLIGKEEESFPIPDFGSIEIKTRYRNSKFPISLFNATPDGDFLFPMQRLYDEYSFVHKLDKRFKVFYANVNACSATFAGRKFKFQLKVDRLSKKIRMIAIDRNGYVHNPDISWSFEFLQEKLERKLKYLAVVKADAHNNIEKQYYKYYQFNFYMLRNFETFISLIEDGTIRIVFMLGCYKSGPKRGLMNNHGSSFDISEDDLEKLFIKVC